MPDGYRFDAFSQLISQRLAPMHLSTDDVGAFRARMHTSNLGVVQLTVLRVGHAFVAHRAKKHIDSNDPGQLKVVMQLRGTSVVSQNGREAKLGPGDFALYDTIRPYKISGSGSFRMQTVMFARNALRLSSAQLELLSTRRISGRAGSGLLAMRYFAGLAQQLETGTCQSSCHLADATLDLLAASFAEQLAADPAADAEGGMRCSLLRVQTYIEERLGDADLGLATIAAAHYISVRSLQQLFADHDQTVTGWIRGRRIEHCRRDLANPALAHEPVSSIAAKWGLFDRAGFSRLFKSVCGLSPREYRATALACSSSDFQLS